MSDCVIELVDSEIRVARGKRVIVRSPGYAVIRAGKTVLGEQALREAHLHPRDTYNRFWSNLSQDPLQTASEHVRHHADLAYAHLLSLHEQAGKPKEVVFAVPGSYSRDQLALLLGIAQACPFAAVGLVDTGVAAASVAAGPGSYLYVDMQLHRMLVTRLAVDDMVVRESVETIENGGLVAIHDVSAELIADAFIAQCRFDPLHLAETEQALFDQLPQYLKTLSERPEVVLEIQFRGSRHQARLKQTALLEKLEPHYVEVIQRLDADRVALLSSRCAALPGLADRIPGAHVLEADAPFSACSVHASIIRSTGPDVSFITRLPAPPRPRVTAAGVPPQEEITERRDDVPEAVTHLLSGHRAYPLTASPWFLSAAGGIGRVRDQATSCCVVLNSRRAVVEPLSDINIYVNGTRLSGKRELSAGDKISFAGTETVYSLITMVDPDAA
ncbi:MAG: hypothetical protein HYY36_05020 [Gammaproteobacteria bacterium]|nr:hypothetical protein [Gammaproteobacteria bacterium]